MSCLRHRPYTRRSVPRWTTPGTGMLLNNTMNIFDPHPGNANSIAPGKRMASSMAPTVVMKDGKPFVALGTPGATRIFPSVLQAIVNVIDHGMSLQEAVEAPRVWTQGQSLEVEGGIRPDVRKRLQTMGHDVQGVPKVAGGMNGVMFDHRRGVITARPAGELTALPPGSVEVRPRPPLGMRCTGSRPGSGPACRPLGRQRHWSVPDSRTACYIRSAAIPALGWIDRGGDWQWLVPLQSMASTSHKT